MNKVLALFAIVLLALAVPLTALAQAAGETTSPSQMSDFALWGIVSGALTSVVTAMINRQRWASDAKLSVFFALCCLTAAGNAHFTRELDFDNWIRALLLVTASGWVTYTAAKPAIKTIEERTG